MDKFLAVLKSRKFWGAVVALLIAFFGERAGVDASTLTKAITACVAYILGVALEDGLSRR